MRSAAVRFWAKVEKQPNGCWLWIGARHKLPFDYGTFWVDGNWILAHRFSYGPVPVGLVLDHLCRVPSCVNPEHLEAVPQQVNVARAQGLGRHNREKTTCPKNHPFDEANTLYKRNGSRQCRHCHRDRMRNRRPFLRDQKLFKFV